MAIFQSQCKAASFLTEQERFESLLADIQGLSDHERAFVERLLKDSDASSSVYSLEFDREMVSVGQWLEDPYYMGEIGKMLYGPWKRDLIELFESQQYDQALIVGGIGSGKSTFSQVAVIRMLYEASCLRDPVQSYGLAKGSKIGFCNLATSKETARRVVFEGIVAKLRESPYFMREFPMIKDVKEEIIFPKGLVLVAGSSTDTSVIGMNIFGGIIDEGNFLTRKPSQRHGGTERSRRENYTQAHRLYESITRRMKSRYLKKGRLPGILIVSSSKTTQDSFTEQIIREAKASGNNRIFVSDRSIIDVKRESFSDKTFHVLVGNEKYRSKILQPEEVDSYKQDPEASIVEIPEDLRIDFETDLDAALRDLAGVATIAISSFFQKVEAVDAMFTDEISHPFVCVTNANPAEWDSLLPYRINWSAIARQDEKGEWRPIRHPEAPRFVHLDPAKSGDAFALAVGHVSGWKDVPKQEGVADTSVERQPMFEVDFMLRIKAQPGEEIQFRNVRQLIYEFSSHGFYLSRITTDTFQSVDMIQTLQARGYRAEVLSVDTSKAPYLVLRNAIYEGRVRSYCYSILADELKRLEDTPQKIDHPSGSGSSKDLADALCGVVYSLSIEMVYSEGLSPEKGISVFPAGLINTENFASAGVHHSGELKVKVDEPAFAKKPKTVAPTYRKVKTDGTAVDARNGDDFFFMIG